MAERTKFSSASQELGLNRPKHAKVPGHARAERMVSRSTAATAGQCTAGGKGHLRTNCDDGVRDGIRVKSVASSK